MKILKLGIVRGLNYELLRYLPYGILFGKDRQLAIMFFALTLF
mgnify:CR=1 FL=1